MRQKRKELPYVLIVTLGIFALAGPAYARRDVWCTFTVQQDPDHNVQAFSRIDKERVRNNEYDRLVSAGPNAVEVDFDGGNHCYIRHSENVMLGSRVAKQDVMLDPAGVIPDCSDFHITVACSGEEPTSCSALAAPLLPDGPSSGQMLLNLGLLLSSLLLFSMLPFVRRAADTR